MLRGRSSWPRLGPATPALQTSSDGGLALHTSKTAPPLVVVITWATPLASCTLRVGYSTKVSPAPASGGLVNRIWLKSVLLPPAFVAVTEHWKPSASDTSP